MADLKTLVPLYYENKTSLDFYKKQCDAQNSEIKKLMAEQKIKDFEADGVTVKYIIQNKESMDESRLIQVLKKGGYSDIIKTREYVDMDALENALYHDTIDKDTIVEMDKCRECKEVVQLRVSKKKEKKS